MRKIPMILAALTLASLGGWAAARDVAPTNPPKVEIIGQAIDRTQPAAINSPKFLKQRSVPAGLAEREWAYRFTLPTFGCYGFGYGGFYGGWGYGGYGGYYGGFGGSYGSGASIQSGVSLP